MAGTIRRNALAAMNLRLLLVAGWRSHLALFSWMRPSAFLPTVVGVPLVQLLWFVHLGHYAGVHPTSYYAVGNAVQSCAIAGLFAPAMSIQGERLNGTLSAVLATPANRTIMFVGRVLPAIGIGFLTSLLMLGVGMLFTDVEVTAAQAPALLLVMLVSATSCGAFGLLIGAVGLLSKEAMLMANFASYLMLLVCGVNISLDALPGWLAAIGHVMPMSDGIEAARAVISDSGANLPRAVLRELAKTLVFSCAAALTLRACEITFRKSASGDGI
ncbi:ABC transporter permease [Streptomyces sp. NPDC005863]|uniref:ABC transporter permease n=1 Tax=unclassified Streptomyces TaxID=2593676 RepID=UPI00341024A6